jgi:protein-S-isoprenylcysteine O-methyltransferase Ste14
LTISANPSFSENGQMNRNTIISGLSLIGILFVMTLIFSGSLWLIQYFQIPHLLDLIPFCPLFILQLLGGICIVLWLPIFLMGLIDLVSGGKVKSQGHLRMTGIYQFVRKPIQGGICATTFGIGSILNHTGLALSCILLWIAVFVFGKFEEKHLTDEFGQEYLQYKNLTPMLMPKFHKLFRTLMRTQ